MSDVGSGKLSDSRNEVRDIRKARRYPTDGKAGERGGEAAPNGSRQKSRPTGRTKNDRRAQPLYPRSGGRRAQRGGGPRSPTNRGGRGAPPRDGAQVAAATAGTEGAKTQARKLTKTGGAQGATEGRRAPSRTGHPRPEREERKGGGGGIEIARLRGGQWGDWGKAASYCIRTAIQSYQERSSPPKPTKRGGIHRAEEAHRSDRRERGTPKQGSSKEQAMGEGATAPEPTRSDRRERRGGIYVSRSFGGRARKSMQQQIRWCLNLIGFPSWSTFPT